ncbi:MAG TPA: DinB family protein [Vicinamibacterales bacterium]
MTYYGASELARSFRTVRKNTLIIAEEIPEEKYDFRPTPESRSVREILAHIAVSSQGNYRGHAVRKITTFIGIDYPTMVKERLEQEKQLSMAPKAQLIDLLRTDGENWGRYLDTVPEEELAVIIPFSEPAVPRTKSRFEMLLSAKEHEMHHRAQLMVYQRLLGLVPHLTRERQARAAQPLGRS